MVRTHGLAFDQLCYTLHVMRYILYTLCVIYFTRYNQGLRMSVSYNDTELYLIYGDLDRGVNQEKYV